MNVVDAGSTARGDGRVYPLQIYPRLSPDLAQCCKLQVSKSTTAAEVIQNVAALLKLDATKCYVLAEVKECGGEEWVLEAGDLPVHRVLLWPRRAQEEHPQSEGFYFVLQERNLDGSIRYMHLPAAHGVDDARCLLARGFLPPRQQEVDDLCNLPNLTEESILANLRLRFQHHSIYTYAGSILIAINPFKFLSIYNPKYVKKYDNHQLGKLEPHIFAIADVAYHTMLKKQVNQCIVISGESGSGKTQSTSFLIHCLTALSQKGYASGVERTILGAGPVLEAFGNAKTAHNNNSSRFGKFIQVNYLESGIVRGAVVEKYLLEKSRLVSREKNERNYHAFYYLLLGSSEEEHMEFKLLRPEDYFYLRQENFQIEDGEDHRHEFQRLKQAMEMVGFLPATTRQIFSVLSAILYLGNVTYKKKSTGRDEGLDVGPPEVLSILSELLRVKQELLVEALTKRKTVTVNEKLILHYSLNEAVTARDSMAKSLYSALFDWIVLRINHALLNKRDMEESISCLSIGVLDIFGFEDFKTNSFEQFCINYANEQLQYYFNQHIFKLEQEEYKSEGITWHNIDYTDNVGCIQLISKKPTGLFYLLDEESNFPHATNETLLAKFKQQHEDNRFFVATPVLEPAFIIRHFAGKVKYQIKDFREKNTDYMRPDIVALLRSSDRAYIRELVGMDPVAMFRWSILRATIRGIAAFQEAGRAWAAKTAGVVRRGSRIPLGELKRANTPIEKMYRRCSLLDFSFDKSEELPLEAFEDIFTYYDNKKDQHAQIMKSIRGLQLDSEDPGKFLRSWRRTQQPRSHDQKSRTNKQKQLIPKNLLDSQSLKHIVSMTLYDRTTKALLHLHKKKKPPSISAQFQTSLSKLLETLGKAEPFFIRCIRSNAGKRELYFDEALVLQQLRYTGMLETVRIRRSGYSAKYTFQEFIDHFRVLLPKNSRATQDVISALFTKMELDKNNYQIGRTKVFMKESERQRLQDILHNEVIQKIIFLQRWFRAILDRRRFQCMRRAAISIQREWRTYRFYQKNTAARIIQTLWRGYRQRMIYQKQLQTVLKIQAIARGRSARERASNLLKKKQEAGETERQLRANIQAKEDSTQPTKEIKPINEVGRPAEQQIYKHSAKNEGEHQNGTSSKNETARAAELQMDKHLGGIERWQPVNPMMDKTFPKNEVEQPTENLKDEKDRKTPLLSQKSLSTESIDRHPSNQEKRERRRQRGLEHDKLQNKLASSASLEEHVPNTVFSEKEPVRTDSKELDQYIYIEVKVKDSPGKKDGKPSPSILPRPNSLPLNTIGSSETSCKEPSSPNSSALQRYSNQAELLNKAERWRERSKQEGGPVETPEHFGNKESPAPLTDRRHSGDGAVGLLSNKEALGTHRKRRLAHIRSELVHRDLDMEETEYWPSPLPLLTPDLPATYLLPSPSMQIPSGSIADGAMPSIPKKKRDENEQRPTTPQHPNPFPPDTKTGFFRKILKKDKRTPRDALQTPEEPEMTFSQIVAECVASKTTVEGPQHQQPRPHPGESATLKLRRNCSIKISNVSEQWGDSKLCEISNSNELKELDEFLGNQVNDLRSRGIKLSEVENIFITATVQFRETLKSIYSVQKQSLSYKELLKIYKKKVVRLAGEKQKTEVQLVTNLFQSVLDGFIRREVKKGEVDPKSTKAEKRRRKKEKSLETYMGHTLISYQVSIVQSCEWCTSYIWVMEKALMCRSCKMAFHKKCKCKIQSECPVGCRRKGEPESHHFGISICSLTSDKNPVPVVMQVLLEYVEIHGLYTEGIYRKSGTTNRMKELQILLESDPTKVNLEGFPIHAIAGVLKKWLRDLPEPLMTFALYNDFLHAVDLPEKQEQVQTIYRTLGQLPPAHYSTLERLVFHLVRVAKFEESNRMSPNALAIVFAPCILRCPDNEDPLMSMKDIAKTTMCVEMIINEQIRIYNQKIEEIEQLEFAETLAVNQLRLKRQNTITVKRTLDETMSEDYEPTDSDIEADTLIERIRSIKQEKEEITYGLPELDHPGSDQENVDSEASASTESLLEERPSNSDTEGSLKKALSQLSSKNSRPQFVHSDSSLHYATVRSQYGSIKVPSRNPIMPTSNIKLPPGMQKQVSTELLPERKLKILQLVKLREQPARRKDSIHSVYIMPGVEPILLPPSVGDCNSSDKFKRRFSNPDIPYIDEQGEA
ncbi:unconventional myosin-IXb isoform X2 [Erpetoichthys calabaricus]|uniref:unconventional myosin-IXb isoform X2 n=1 Tax=Erpetoichthys calabaricus TaxID=27687 RepID=UPI002234E7C5|nr:unconventional myosin-IXb isoform X2 [Erpetoichthys calabaricus]